jgi:serine/threonine-protein kinase
MEHARAIVDSLLESVPGTVPSDVGAHVRNMEKADAASTVLEAVRAVLEWLRRADSDRAPPRRSTASLHDETDPLIGATLLDRFRIVARLGSGGMGAVYRARQLSVERDVAVKILRSDRAGADTAARFEREARVIAKLKHPNIVSVIDYGVTEGRAFIAMELLEGKTLEQRMLAGPFDEGGIRWLLRETCEALVEAHSRGVVHRDIKPSNLFLEPLGSRDVLKVVDFGIARLLDDPSLTSQGMLMGTPKYLSPEQASSGAIGPKSDIYSLGIVAYECLTGKLPFDADSAVKMIVRHATAEPRPLRTTCPSLEISTEVESLVMSMVAKDPRDRPSASEVLERLRVEKAPEPKRRARSSWPAVAVVSLLVAIGVAAALKVAVAPAPEKKPAGVARPVDPPPPAPQSVSRLPVSPPPPPPPPAVPKPVKPKLPEGFEDFDTP